LSQPCPFLLADDAHAVCTNPYPDADFFYEREDLNGIAVFVDGPHHDEEAQREQDSRERRKLEDMGYRVIVIRYDKTMQEQIRTHADVFGRGLG
jgi:very-short-patch-repair endonuclease